MNERIKIFVQNKLSNLNKADLTVTMITVLVCSIYKFLTEDWYNMNFILFFICIKFVFLITKSIVCKENIDECHLIKLMFLSLIFVFFQMVLSYLKPVKFLFSVAILTVILINSVLRTIVLHNFCF